MGSHNNPHYEISPGLIHISLNPNSPITSQNHKPAKPGRSMCATHQDIIKTSHGTTSATALS
eukprot:2671024-Ditylum_brightwellii.AAC.1